MNAFFTLNRVEPRLNAMGELFAPGMTRSHCRTSRRSGGDGIESALCTPIRDPTLTGSQEDDVILLEPPVPMSAMGRKRPHHHLWPITRGRWQYCPPAVQAFATRHALRFSRPLPYLIELRRTRLDFAPAIATLVTTMPKSVDVRRFVGDVTC